MTTPELVAAALKLHGASLLAAAGPAWYMLKGELLDKQIDRAETIVADSRGKLATSFATELERFSALHRKEVAQFSIVGADGNQLEAAKVDLPEAVNSEQFRQVVRDFLDDRSPTMKRYHCANFIVTSLKSLQIACAILIAGWLLSAGACALYFALCSFNAIDPFEDNWLRTMAIIGLVPPAFLLALAPLIFAAIGRLTSMSKP